MTQTRGRAAAPAAPSIPTSTPGTDLPLERAFGALPNGYLTSAARQRLAAFARRADALGRLDPRTQEVYVDEKALRALLRQLFPRSFEEECVAVLRAAPDSALRGPAPAGDAEGRPLRWLDLAGRVEALRPTPEVTLAALGQPAAGRRGVAGVDVTPAVRRLLPGAPAGALTGGAFERLMADLVAPASAPAPGATPRAAARPRATFRSVFNCVSRRLGFLAAVALVLAIGVALAVSGGAAAGIAAALAAAGFGGFVVTVILNCIVNPAS